MTSHVDLHQLLRSHCPVWLCCPAQSSSSLSQMNSKKDCFISSPAWQIFFAHLSQDISYKMTCSDLFSWRGVYIQMSLFPFTAKQFYMQASGKWLISSSHWTEESLGMHLRLFRPIIVLDMIWSTIYCYFKSPSKYFYTSLSCMNAILQTMRLFSLLFPLIVPQSYINIHSSPIPACIDWNVSFISFHPEGFRLSWLSFTRSHFFSLRSICFSS